MIGRLTGKVIEKIPPMLVIDVQGVGYEVEVPMNTFYSLPDLQETMTLFTHMIVREDAQFLCGFISDEERRLFRTLIKVNGVGAKLALAILSSISAQEFARCVNENDTKALIQLPGIGKKTAERLIIEVRDKLKDWLPASLPTQGHAQKSVAQQDETAEATSALIALGYKPQEASMMVQQALSDSGEGGITSGELIRAALKNKATV
ncbi:Holliday junction ATP-dependent DNA helicase RuvA [hydrothermal vent metagenome]|uniref:Holliday junction ATP-dependent DNA helicase RuvA n=1 Tax=hydrothermal vent metagenome TaxID=652676 RepID=A0A3B0ZW42_9ZZZZ